ncbi:MAG TPA: VOC family protein [Steroidobacteraceae bacterium]|nr:VOC family protein [Steroidobacteraceae bacterium]
MPTTLTHLHFRGNCSEAFRFYAATFGGRIVFSMTYGEAPGAAPAAPEVRDQIIHARVDLGDDALLGCDVPPDRYEKPQGFNVMANATSPGDAERLFRTLSEGGTVDMPIQETFWAWRFGMCTDRFGTPWMVNCAKPPEALAAAARKSA